MEFDDQAYATDNPAKILNESKKLHEPIEGLAQRRIDQLILPDGKTMSAVMKDSPQTVCIPSLTH